MIIDLGMSPPLVDKMPISLYIPANPRRKESVMDLGTALYKKDQAAIASYARAYLEVVHVDDLVYLEEHAEKDWEGILYAAASFMLAFEDGDVLGLLSEELQNRVIALWVKLKLYLNEASHPWLIQPSTNGGIS
jgi:hypothetical protein